MLVVELTDEFPAPVVEPLGEVALPWLGLLLSVLLVPPLFGVVGVVFVSVLGVVLLLPAPELVLGCSPVPPVFEPC